MFAESVGLGLLILVNMICTNEADVRWYTKWQHTAYWHRFQSVVATNAMEGNIL